MSKLVGWLRERVSRATVSGSLLPAYRTVYGEAPVIRFSDYVKAYLKDPSCKAFVDFLADQIVGTGFYTTVNKEYPRAEEAKRVVDEFCESVNLDEKLQIGAREFIGAGNSFWEKVEPDKIQDLRILPLTSIEKIKRSRKGVVEGYVQSAVYGGNTLSPERIIHFKWNPVDCEPFGTGILRSLLEKLTLSGGETRMSFLEMKARIEKMLPEIFEKYAGPDELWVFKDVPDDKLTEYQALIKKKPKAGARFVYNKEADIKSIQLDPRTQFQSYLEHIFGQVNMGGQSPISSLMISPNYLTKASSEAAMELVERKVLAAQRYIKRIIEREVFSPVLEQAGHNPREARVRLQWGIPKRPEIVVADLIRAAELRLIRPDEFRNIMKGLGWELMDLEDTEETGVKQEG